MRKGKKSFLFLFLLFSFFFLPTCCLAKTDPYIDKLYMDVTIHEDGSISIKEIDSYVGSFNGVTASFGYKNRYAPTFTGTKEDFYGSDIYNGSRITDLKVGDIDKKNLNFNHLFKVKHFYDQALYQQTNGTYGVYNYDEDFYSVDLKVYCPSKKEKAIYYEYTIHDMVVEHNDVAELAWTILNKDDLETSIDNLEIKIHLPQEDSTMRAWGHGALQGYLKRDSDHLVTLHVEDLGPYNDLGVRIMFSKDIVTSSKQSNIDGKEYILEVEKELAEKANQIRKSAQKKVSIVKGSTMLWIFLLLAYILYTYIKYDREYRYHLNNEYLREIPAEYPPYVLEYLLKKKVTSLSFSTTILDLIRKKVILFEENPKNKKDYVLKLVDESVVVEESEKKVLHLLFSVVGNNKKVSLSQIKKFGNTETSAMLFLNSFKSWKAQAIATAQTQNFYESHGIVKTIGILFSLLSGVLFYMNIILETEVDLCNYALSLGIFSLIYFIVFKKKSKKGMEQYTKWMAFKKFLKDFGRFNEKELPEIKLWEQYLVYAHILGIAKELEKEMKIKINEMHLEESPTWTDFYLMNRMMDIHLHTTIASSINKAITVSNAKIAESRSSSAGGMGGGFSGGGGSFGGGGGRGSF